MELLTHIIVKATHILRNIHLTKTHMIIPVGWEYNEASADFSTNINSYQSSVNENRYTTGLFFEIDKEYFMGTILSFSSRFDSISDFHNKISS